MLARNKVMILLMMHFLIVNEIDAQENKAPRNLVYVGAFKGEITKVIDKGGKIEVEYKELVTTTIRSPNTTVRGGTSGKYRPPVPREFTFKEKTRELELRVFEETIVRLMDNNSSSTEKTGTVRKKSTQEDSEAKISQSDEEATKTKSGAKANRKRVEAPLPGKAGDRSSLAKGQVVIVQVAREDLQGFSRLVATSIVILGEK